MSIYSSSPFPSVPVAFVWTLKNEVEPENSQYSFGAADGNLYCQVNEEANWYTENFHMLAVCKFLIVFSFIF